VLINVVQIINTFNLNNPKHLFLISYKGAFRLTTERGWDGFKRNRVFFCGNSYRGGEGGGQYFGIRTRFDSKRVRGGRHIYLYKSAHLCLVACSYWFRVAKGRSVS
jgi:hypothetical protein